MHRVIVEIRALAPLYETHKSMSDPLILLQYYKINICCGSVKYEVWT